MPRKLRQLLSELGKHGFTDRGGEGSHRNLVHGKGIRITISEKLGDEAKKYQERAVAEAIERIKK